MNSFILVLYTVILLGFGYIMTVRFLKENNILAVIGFMAILGPAAYMVLTNVLGHLMPIKFAFIAGLIFLAALQGGILLFTRKSTVPWIVPPRVVIWILVSFSVLIGFTYARTFPSDFLSWSHEPLVATMAEGNFPPHGPFAPWGRLRYHYGPEVLAASLLSLADVAPLDGYGPQPLLGAFGVLCIVGALVYGWTKSWKTATLASVLAMGGGGWIWFNVTDLISDLFHHFILGEKIVGPFRALSFMGFSPIANSIAIRFAHRSTALGFAFLYGLLYAGYQATEKKNQRAPWILTSIVFGTALALTMETGLLIFAAGSAAFLGYVLLAHIADRKSLSSWKTMTAVFTVILGVTGVIALFQGGMLSPFGGGTSAGSIRLFLTTYFDPWGARRIYVGEWMFIRDFGLPLLLMPVTAWFCWKRRHEQPWYALVFSVSLTFLCVPILTKFSPRHYETLRLFWGTTSFSSLLIGIMLSEWVIGSRATWKRYLGGLAIVSMLISTSVWLLLSVVFPDHHLKLSPLFVSMDQIPPLSPGSQELFRWAKSHSKPTDYFYVRPAYEQAVFTTITGRTAIGPRYGDDFPLPALILVSEFEGSCDPTTFREIGAKFLVIMHPGRVDWFRLKCNPAEWETIYDGSTTDMPLPIVYVPR